MLGSENTRAWSILARHKNKAVLKKKTKKKTKIGLMPKGHRIHPERVAKTGIIISPNKQCGIGL